MNGEAASASIADRLELDDAVLSRGDLATLGYPRRSVDRIFGTCPVIALPGSRKPLIHVGDFRRVIAEHTYDASSVRP